MTDLDLHPHVWLDVLPGLYWVEWENEAGAVVRTDGPFRTEQHAHDAIRNCIKTAIEQETAHAFDDR